MLLMETLLKWLLYLIEWLIRWAEHHPLLVL